MDGPLAKLFGLPSLNEVLCALGFSIERSMRKFLNMENDMLQRMIFFFITML